MDKFLTDRALSDAIKLTLDCEEPRCAVAFWGEGATYLFGKTVRNAKIVCNLKMGGTNPKVIGELRQDKARFTVRQCDTLHSKVYLGRGNAVVTSANASCNGLALEGIEAAGWTEAGVSLTDINSVSSWFDMLWARSREITPADMKRADEAWKRRRRSCVVPKGATLFDALRQTPESFKDRRYFLVAYSVLSSPKLERALKQERRARRAGSNLGGYEDWPDLPQDGDLVDFYVPERGVVKPQGYWYRPETDERQDIQLCWSGTKYLPKLKLGNARNWDAPLKAFKKSRYWKEDGGYLDLGQFGEEFLR